MKILRLLAFVFIAFALASCGEKESSETPNESSQTQPVAEGDAPENTADTTTPTTRAPENNMCDEYIEYLNCVISKSPAARKEAVANARDIFKKSVDGYSPQEKKKTCDLAVEKARDKALLFDQGCKL